MLVELWGFEPPDLFHAIDTRPSVRAVDGREDRSLMCAGGISGGGSIGEQKGKHRLHCSVMPPWRAWTADSKTLGCASAWMASSPSGLPTDPASVRGVCALVGALA